MTSVWPASRSIPESDACPRNARPRSPSCPHSRASVFTSSSIPRRANTSQATQRLAADQPQVYALPRVMPDTLAWLERHTAPGSVVLAPQTVMDTLAIHTHNKVYWGMFAGQHVISDAEEETRAREVQAWESGQAGGISYRADYVLQLGGACGRMAAETVVFRSEREGTCVGRGGVIGMTDERAVQVTFTDDEMSVCLMDGRTITVPLAWYPRLLNATSVQRENWQIAGGGYGLHWPDIDEDLSTEGLLRGAPAPNLKL